MKKKIYSLLALFAISFAACGSDSPEPSSTNPNPTPPPNTPTEVTTSFVRGADISWYTEMAADGKHFYNVAGKERTCPVLMKELGVNAIRLRVWVNPENAACHFNNTVDVVAKAKAAKEAGMDVMIDFHYSDLWADPSRQQTPEAWKNLDLAALSQQVATHTRTVLQAVVAAGITPKWVQIGNETRNGMLHPMGQLWNEKGDISTGWSNFVNLYNSGYNAAKAVLPQAQVMLHLNTASKAADNRWWLQQFKTKGGKFDAVAFSHYPQVDQEGVDPLTVNTQAISYIKEVHNTYKVPVVVAEFGVKSEANEALATQVTTDFMTKAKALGINVCSGVFYWEPEVWGSWRPQSYTTFFDNWGAYDMGAFTKDGKPSKVMESFCK